MQIEYKVRQHCEENGEKETRQEGGREYLISMEMC